ncbi:MAG: DUF6580 family putative transport protein [Bacteroidia bacterium]
MKVNIKNGILVLVVLAAAFSRLIPHPTNFTPIGAIALFGAAYFSNRLIAFLIPALAIFLSSLVINNAVYQPESFVWFYEDFPAQILAFGLITLLGLGLLKQVKVKNVLLSSLAASILLFVITNFSAWLTTGMYEQTWSGLVQCYTMAIPFFGNTILGDLVYCGVLFGGYEWARRQVPALARA